MYWKSSLIGFWILAFSCKEPAPQVEAESGYSNPKALIEASELHHRLGEDGLQVIDFRKLVEYEEGHIPGALQMWRSDIENPAAPVRGMMAEREDIEALFSRMGIRQSDTLILYDAHAGCDAARLWWVLEVYGFRQVRLLNGGLHAWKAQKGPLTSTPPAHIPGTFRLPVQGNEAMRIGADSLMHRLAWEDCIVLDARSEAEYSGERLKKGATRAGRIPGSHHRDWAEATHYGAGMTFRSPEELREIYAFLPEHKNKDVIVYCHSGVRSAHTAFVLTQLLGYPRVRNFDGSWIQWSAIDTAQVLQDRLTTLFE